jgi:hypothetical protein
MAIPQQRTIPSSNKAETARRFFASFGTIRSWLSRADDDSFVQTRPAVNRLSDSVRYAVQQIRQFCPTLGNAKNDYGE